MLVQAPDAWLGDGLFLEHDLGHHHTPWRAWAAGTWGQGELPLWCSEVGSGFPLMADAQTGVLYPVNILLGFLVGPWQLVTASLVVHQVWAALGAFWLCRVLGRSREAAMLAGLGFALGGFFVSHFTYAGMQAVLSWLPWLLGLALRLGRGERLLAPFGVAVACVLTAGHPQMAVVALLGGLVVLLAQRPRKLHALAGGVLGLLAASPQLLATGELVGRSARAGGVDAGFANIGSLPPWELVNLALPRFWGFERPADLALTYVHKGSLYVGSGETHWEDCLYLGWPVLLLALAGRSRLWWGLGLGGLVLALGRYTPVWWVLQQLPGLDHLRFPVRFAALTVLAACVLAAEGYDRATSLKRPAQLLGAALALSALGAAVLWVALPAERADVAAAMGWNATWGLMFGGLSLLACWLAPRRLLPALLLLDLSLSLWAYNPRSPAPEPPAWAMPSGRVAVVDRVNVAGPMVANLSLMWGASEVIVPSPLLLPYHEEVLAEAGLDIGREHGPAKAERVMSHLDLVRRLGVEVLVSPHPLELPELAPGVYRVPDPGPLEWQEAGLRVRSETWYPGWLALVDGEERAVERIHGSLRAVRAGPEATVEWIYRPWWRCTFWPAGAAWVLLLVGAVYTGCVRHLVPGAGGGPEAE